MPIEYITLIAVLVLSYIGHNMTVAYAAGILLVVKFLGLTSALHALGTHGLNWGILLLTVAVLVPLADGTITVHDMVEAFKTPVGIIAITAGLLAAIAGGSGVDLLKNSPQIVPALVIGTMAGVFFFKGVAVGPLIAAGVTYFAVWCMKLLGH